MPLMPANAAVSEPHVPGIRGFAGPGIVPNRSRSRVGRGVRRMGLGFLLPVLAACSSGSPAADYPGYSTVDEMIAAADVIVTGRVLSTRVEDVYADQDLGTDPGLNPQAGAETADRGSAVMVTVAEVEVTHAMKGDVREGQLIEVSQLGTPDQPAAGTTLVEPGDSEYAFVLNHHDGAPYDLVNPAQGLYRVGADGALTTIVQGNELPIEHVADLEARP